MSNINNHEVDMNNKQIKDLYSIEAVQDLSHEAAATISGGSVLFLGQADWRGIKLRNAKRSLGPFNNKASVYWVMGSGDWIVYSGKNFKGQSRRLESGSSGRLGHRLYIDIESARPVRN
ncbi:hypothetical protein A6770_30430 [Nostoc minutum NIES-26]|uniref:Beta/gamma crystallin 'Greek key' domain-containing protein n=1 Tax=Nostoc minutum NIES-26 TaxID=1844469 RepID=A0A367QB88_9NOSO|nr:hypothetical protein A6770_30430 [Nostoc minutum NIES-26]